MNSEYAKFCELFSRAECRLKIVEKISTVVVTPSVNELRYAGCHIRRSFIATVDADRLAEIASAERHCLRSIYDSCAVVVDVINCWMQEYLKGFWFVEIRTIVPNHLEMQKKIRDSVRFLDAHNHEDAQTVCNEIETRMADLVDIRDTYEAARDDLVRAARIRNIKGFFALLTLILGCSLPNIINGLFLLASK